MGQKPQKHYSVPHPHLPHDTNAVMGHSRAPVKAMPVDFIADRKHQVWEAQSLALHSDGGTQCLWDTSRHLSRLVAAEQL